MLSWIDTTYGHFWGPLRLFNSFFFMAAVGYATAALATFVLLPRLWDRLPRDQGRASAVNAEQSVGKPVSAGVISSPASSASPRCCSSRWTRVRSAPCR